MIDSRSEVKLLRAIVAASMDGILLVRSGDGTVAFANPAALRLLGYSDGDLVGRHYSALFPPESGLSRDELLSAIVENDGVFVQEFELKNGEPRVLDLMASLLADGADDHILMTIRDVRERCQAEQERNRLLAELEERLAEIRTLSGLIPICAWCRRVREDEGYWTQIEEFVEQRSDAGFSHGVCPDCQSELMDKEP